MIDPGTLITLLIAAVASLFMAWTIGAGSAGSTPFAPAVGANAIPIMRAAFIVGLFVFVGALTQGASVSEAVGNELIHDITISPLAATTALLIAAILVSIGIFTGYPIATAFTVTGAVIGVGLALGGTPAWSKYIEIIALWTVTPFIGASLAYVIARLLIENHISEERLIPLLAGGVGLILANMEFAILGPSGTSESIANLATTSAAKGGIIGVSTGWVVSLGMATGCAYGISADLRRNLIRGQQHFLLALGCLVAFSAGGSQVGLAIGPLLPLFAPFQLSIIVILLGGGIGLLLGSWMGAPRMIKALAQDYSSLGPRRSIAALIPAFLIAQTAILFGIPVSFNEIMVSTIIGSGYAVGTSPVGRRKITLTVLAWIGSLILALGLGYSTYTLLSGGVCGATPCFNSFSIQYYTYIS